MEQPLILTAAQASLYDEAVIGGKARNMAWLTRNGLPVPRWIVLTTVAFRAHLTQDNLADRARGLLSDAGTDPARLASAAAAIRSLIIGMQLPGAVLDEFRSALAEINGWEQMQFAVRSSAVGEDAAGASFAGQMDSFLYQDGFEKLTRAILGCFASAFSDRAIAYRLSHGFDILDIRSAVIIQQMIQSEISGVLFTSHPVTGSRRHALVSACYGSGEGIVSGACNTDEFSVDTIDGDIEPFISVKDTQILFDLESGSGTRETAVPESLRNTPCLSDEQVRSITAMGCSIAGRLRFPQDIEWTISDGSLYILQTRPITSLPAPSQPRGRTIVWDNSNIQESYCGVTTPLTFSFASRAYAIVYEETFRLLGVPDSEIKELLPTYRNMLGLIKGRVYYNINNWYRALLVLPSFSQNKADMERMMGLQDPVDFVEDKNLTTVQRIRRLPILFRALYTLKSGFRNIDALVVQFKDLFQREYDAVDRSKLHALEIGELMELADHLKDQLLYRWQTPIINDFFVMMMNGRVHRWLERAEVENLPVLQNNLMAGEEGIESTEPTKFLLRICDDLRSKPALVDLFRRTENHRLLDALQVAAPRFHEECLRYIELYGDRCMGELKLESITLRQDPSFMFAVIKNFLTRDDLSIETLSRNERQFRAGAETTAFTAVKSRLGFRSLRKFKRDLIRLRQAVKNRENMRLTRTRGFGLIRDVYLEVGNQLAFYGILDDNRDIFYLTVEELETYMDGRCVQSNLKDLVAARRREYASYEGVELPHHFSTFGPVYHHNAFEYQSKQVISETAVSLSGIGCYPGIVENRVKLIFSPQDELNLEGQILCTVRTDPGWAPLFPTAGGILVERGSTLSHSAVVARELGIPAIVNIPGLTKILKNGELIRMDGSTGTIIRLEAPPEE